MTTEARCENTDLLVSQCAHCKGHKETDPYEGVLIERFNVVARFDSRCAIDRSHIIYAGDYMAFAVQREGKATKVGWVCEKCVERMNSG